MLVYARCVHVPTSCLRSPGRILIACQPACAAHGMAAAGGPFSLPDRPSLGPSPRPICVACSLVRGMYSKPAASSKVPLRRDAEDPDVDLVWSRATYVFPSSVCALADRRPWLASDSPARIRGRSCKPPCSSPPSHHTASSPPSCPGPSTSRP